MNMHDAQWLSQNDLSIIFSGGDGWVIIQSNQKEIDVPMSGSCLVTQVICKRGNNHIKITRHDEGCHKGTLSGRKVKPIQSIQWVDDFDQ